MIPALVIPALMAAFSPSTWIASPTPQSQRGAEERRAEPRAEPKVLIIGIDGVRPDALQAAETPAIGTVSDSLKQRGDEERAGEAESR